MIHHLSWIPPQPDETLEHYAQRLARGIDTSRKFALIGVSFGGMIATEIAKITTPCKTILISSISRRKELPWLYRAAGSLHLHRLMPARAGNNANPLMYWLFGLNTPHDRVLLSQILSDSNTSFTRWAIGAVLGWKNTERPASVVCIHGTRDRVLPARNPQYAVGKGGHLMVVNRAAEISGIINTILADA